MLFVRRRTPPTVVVEDNSAIRAEAAMLAEERGKASGAVAVLGVLAVTVLLLLVGYFAWWAPVNAAQAQPTNPTIIQRDVVEKPVPTAVPTPYPVPTPVPTPAAPPTIIQRDHIVPVPVPTPVPVAPPDNSGNDTTTGGDTTGG